MTNLTPNPTPQPNKAREALRGDIVSTLNALEPGETRVSYPDGHSEIVSNFSLAVDDIMHLVDTYLQNAVEEAEKRGYEGGMVGKVGKVGKVGGES